MSSLSTPFVAALAVMLLGSSLVASCDDRLNRVLLKELKGLGE